MKLSASKWLALFGALRPSNGIQLNKRQSTSNLPATMSDSAIPTTVNMFPAPPGTFTLPPGPQSLVFSVSSLVAEIHEPTTTFITTYSNFAWTVTTEGPTIYLSEITKIPWASIYVEGDPTMLVSETATAKMTASVVTSISCTESVCSPTPTDVSYTCPIVDGATQPVTTIMQSYSCTTGQICEGKPVKTVLTCGCGSPICTTDLPWVPLAPIIIPVGAPVPPTVPGAPDVPEPIPEASPDTPETTMSEEPTTSSREPPTSSGNSSSEDSSSSDASSSTTTTSSSSSGSSSSSSSSSSASVCSYGAFSIPGDFESTLSAWLSQYPIILTSISSSSTDSPVPPVSSTSLTESSSPAIVSSTTISTPTPSPSPTPAPTPTPIPSLVSTVKSKTTSGGCDAACSAASASSAFEAGLSSSMAAGHSSVTQAFSSALSAQSASESSARAISTCQHYTLGYPWNPPDIPVSLATYNGQSKYGTWMCVVNPNKIDTSEEWNSTWKYQPFGISTLR